MRNSNGKANGQFVELVPLEVSNRLAEQAGTDEEDQVGHDDKKDGQCCSRVSATGVGGRYEKRDPLVRDAKA